MAFNHEEILQTTFEATRPQKPHDFYYSHFAFDQDPAFGVLDQSIEAYPPVQDLSTIPRSAIPQLHRNPTTMTHQPNSPELSPPSATSRSWGDEPWHPLKTNATSYNPAKYTDFRVPQLKSDASSVSATPQDSGYATRPGTYSVASGTEPTATDQVCPEVTETFEGLNPFPRQSRSANQLDVPHTSEASETKSPTRSAQSYPCTYCDFVFRLQSEHKKHVLKHERPFRCDQRGCSKRDEGFTTVNDLDRHKKSKHKIFSAGQEKVYKCAAQKCAGKAKQWPRLDNFRQHVKRIHEEEDEEDLVRRSECTADSLQGPDTSEDLLAHEDGIDSGSMSLGDAEVNALPLWTSFPSEAAVSNTTSGQLPPHATPWANLHGTIGAKPNWSSTATMDGNPLGRYPDGLAFTGGAEALSGFDGIQPPVIHYGAQDFPTSRNHELHDLSKDLAMQCENRGSEELTEVIYKFLEDKSLRRHTIPFAAGAGLCNPQRLGPLSPGSRGSDVGTTSAGSYSPRGFWGDAASPLSPRHNQTRTFGGSETNDRRQWGESGVRCDVCSKILYRQCDLKKHMRRHTRPFGCTFDECYKTFGSKNDWKRHENSQHFQYDSWRCEISVPQTDSLGQGTEKPCAHLSHSKQDFAVHLTNAHNIREKPRWEEECKQRRIGVNGQRSFWCGFCQCIYTLKGQGTKAWDDRFDHIASHFTKDPRDEIENWLPPGGTKTKGQLEREMQAASSKRSEDDDEGSDERHEEARASGRASNTAVAAARLQLEAASRKRKRADKAAKDESNLGSFSCCRCGEGPYDVKLYRNAQCSFDGRCDHHFCERCLENRVAPARRAEDASVCSY